LKRCPGTVGASRAIRNIRPIFLKIRLPSKSSRRCVKIICQSVSPNYLFDSRHPRTDMGTGAPPANGPLPAPDHSSSPQTAFHTPAADRTRFRVGDGMNITGRHDERRYRPDRRRVHGNVRCLRHRADRDCPISFFSGSKGRKSPIRLNCLILRP